MGLDFLIPYGERTQNLRPEQSEKHRIRTLKDLIPRTTRKHTFSSVRGNEKEALLSLPAFGKKSFF